MIKSTVIPEIDLGVLIGNFIAVAIIVASLLTFAYLVWGGFEWITSGGDKAGLEAARNRITNAFVGLILVVIAWAIITLAANFLGFPFPTIHIPGLGGGGVSPPVSGCPGLGGKTCVVGTLSPGPCDKTGGQNCCLCQSDGTWIGTTSSNCQVQPGQCQ